MRAPAAVLRRVRCALLLATAAGAATNSPYSFSLSTFSPDGRLQQIEFAFKAVERALPAAAVICADGVVLAKCVRKGDEGLGCAESPHVCRVTEAVVATYAGLPADFRALVKQCQDMAVAHARTWGAAMGVGALAAALGAHLQEHTQLGGLRPFGCSVLLAGVDDDGAPKLYRVDPSGWCAPWTAAAVGAGAGARDRVAVRRTRILLRAQVDVLRRHVLLVEHLEGRALPRVVRGVDEAERLLRRDLVVGPDRLGIRIGRVLLRRVVAVGRRRRVRSDALHDGALGRTQRRIFLRVPAHLLQRVHLRGAKHGHPLRPTATDRGSTANSTRARHVASVGAVQRLSYSGAAPLRCATTRAPLDEDSDGAAGPRRPGVLFAAARPRAPSDDARP